MKKQIFLRLFTFSMAFVAIGFGLLSSFNSNAQMSNVIIDAASGSNGSKVYSGGGGSGMGCYIITVLDCGTVGPVEIGQQSFCSFTGSYGAPYNCEGFGCYGAITQRHCVLKN